jgi:large subunit ribosomal protein L9
MQVIITKPVRKLKPGEIVKVTQGDARNFLLPYGFAMMATQENHQKLEEFKQELSSKHLQDHEQALLQQAAINGKALIFVSQALEDGKLFGSITAKQIAKQLKELHNLELRSDQVAIQGAIKSIGVHKINIFLHHEVSVSILINVARTESEAASQILQFKADEAANAEKAKTSESDKVKSIDKSADKNDDKSVAKKTDKNETIKG